MREVINIEFCMLNIPQKMHRVKSRLEDNYLCCVIKSNQSKVCIHGGSAKTDTLKCRGDTNDNLL